jgi:large conductance mechanosensitive channel
MADTALPRSHRRNQGSLDSLAPGCDSHRLALFMRVFDRMRSIARKIAAARALRRGGTMERLLKDFRDFVMRGNVLDLAVAVIIGVAFNAVVNSLVNDVLMQLIAAVFEKPNFDKLTVTINDGIIYYGRFLTALINFLIVAATLFVIIKAFEEMQKRRRREGEDVAEDKSDEVVLLSEIRDLLRDRA